MMRELSPAERLVVALDFKPQKTDGKQWVKEMVSKHVRLLRGTGVYIKVESALQTSGFDLITFIQSYGMKVFADLKLYGIKETLETDGALLGIEGGPEILTVSCAAGPEAMKALKAQLPKTEVLGVTVLTHQTDKDAKRMFGCTVEKAVLRLARNAEEADIDGLVSSGRELRLLRREFGDAFSLNVPNVRFRGEEVCNDDQNPHRTMSPGEAIRNGATRVIMGRSIIRASDPLSAVMRAIEEIQEELERNRMNA